MWTLGNLEFSFYIAQMDELSLGLKKKRFRVIEKKITYKKVHKVN